MKNILIIGGTGIIGKACVAEALKNDYEVTVLTKDTDSNLPEVVTQISVDRNNRVDYEEKVAELNNKEWDIVFDVYNLDGKDAEQTYRLFKNNSKHIFIISTTLVYDRSKPFDDPIKSSHPLAKRGTMGGYVDHKLDLEDFWQSVSDANWTILRPYHIVGSGSLLGCLPDLNRDPRLLDRINDEEELELCKGGEVTLNYIHPVDIARVVINAAGNPKTFGKSYNVVNPTILTAKEYFKTIGKILGKEVYIKNKSIKEIWEENKGWQLTTLPHVYDVSDLERDIGFVPSIPLEVAIKEAIAAYPEEKDLKQISVHGRMTLLPRPKPIDWLLE